MAWEGANPANVLGMVVRCRSPTMSKGKAVESGGPNWKRSKGPCRQAAEVETRTSGRRLLPIQELSTLML